MRILHVIPQFPYFGGRTIVGGHATCLLTLSVAQHSMGEQVSILSYTAGCDGLLRIDDGPEAYSLFSRAKTRTFAYGIRFCRAAAAWARAHREDFDLVHVHSGYADYFLASDWIKSAARLPTIHTMYCPIPNHGGRWRLPGLHGMIRRWANRLDWRGGISQNVVSSLTAYGLQDVQCIRPALDTDRFAPGDGASARRELGLTDDDLVVLFVGNAKPQKNMLGALRAVHRVRKDFPGVKLVVTTELKHSSSNTDLARLSAEISRLQLESCIIQKGIVENMPALMRACDVLVAPFLDSLGPSDYFMAVLEAMACGKPVVVADVGGMSEVVSDEVGHLVDPRDDAAIADALAGFLGDRPLRKTTGAMARLSVERDFQPATIVAAYRDVYQRITS